LRILLFLFSFYFFLHFFPGLLFYQLGPGPTEPSNAETKGFTKKTLVALFKIR